MGNDVKVADHFFTIEERERIRAAVAATEGRTSGEIATMVVAASDSYREAETLGAVLVSGLLAVIAAVLSHHVTIWSYVPMVALLFFPARLLFRHVPRLKLPLVGRRRLVETVRERAVQAFYEQGLYRTREETGILIFISILERKVWILGDRGINAQIPPGYWLGHAEKLARGLRDGKACDALCSVITSCADDLARLFPRRADDLNELGDEVRG